MLRRFPSRQLILSFKNLNSFATLKRKSSKANIKDDNAPPAYNILQALKLSKSYAMAAFDETVEISVLLNVDPKHGDQVVKGTCIMPHGLGKSAVVAVYTTPDMADKAKEAGADIIVDSTVLNDIKNGVVNFEKFLATPEVVGNLKPFAKILGPKGLMPNAKVGTLVTVDKLEQSIQETKMGSVTFRVDAGSNVHAPLGKISFNDDKLKGNLKAFVQKIIEKKPTTIKGTYILGAVLSSTMGPGWQLNLDSIDPRSKNCLL